MAEESLNFRHNACRIDVKVAGCASEASGFVYRTKPSCDYDYVFTVKHAFQEGDETPNVRKLSHLTIRYDNDRRSRIELYNKNKLEDNLLFIDDLDMVIIRVKNQLHQNVKRIAVKNATDTHADYEMHAHAFITIHREESTLLKCEWKDKERGIFRVDDIEAIERYGGASGSGIYSKDEPFLIGLLSGYRLPDFEQKELLMVKPDWVKINEELHAKKWARLNSGKAKLTAITEERDVIDIRELEINGAVLDMEKAIIRMQHDLVDDWYFDPVHYIDMCNTDFVLDFFSRSGNRRGYKSSKMEVFYLPKKSFVLRKAMVGTFMDRLLYMAAIGQLGDLIDSHLSEYVYSARYNRDKMKPGLIVQGVEQWTKMNYLISDWVEKTQNGCLVKLDLLNYYDTINKNILVRLLNEVAVTDNDKKCINLLDTLMQGFSDKEVNHGIPQNSDASSLLATFYVSHVDEFILSKAVHYCRFMDDMYFVAKDVYEARDLLQTIEKHLRQIDLSLNSEKIKFVRLDDKAEKEAFLEELSWYDADKSKISYLVRSSSKGKRMNAIALLVKQMDVALSQPKEGDAKEIVKEKDRALKFSVSAFSSLHLKLDTEWDGFYQKLTELTEGQVDIPDHTPLLCRLISSIGSWRDVSDIKEAVKKLLLRDGVSIYEWQAYHLWMLMAHLRYDDKELVRYAVDEIEKNDETRRVEVAAIIIYMVTINPEYARVILHKLRGGQLHGNLQYRCALVALRSLDHQVIDEEVSNAIGNDTLCLSHEYLNKHKDKPLVFFHQISSFMMEHDEPIMDEYYSGL